jgi:hypothetical protein
VNPLDAMHGIAWSSTDRRTEAHLASQPVPGDSGSPVLRASGDAQGIISAISPPSLRGSKAEPEVKPSAGTTAVPNLANAVSVMEDETAIEVELETWSTFDLPRAEDLGPAPDGP